MGRDGGRVEGELSLWHTYVYTPNQITEKMSLKSAKIHYKPKE